MGHLHTIWSNAIGYFSDPDHRLAAGMKSREILISDFEAQKQAKGLLDLFRSVLRGISVSKSNHENV